jgi:hypothetical protein
MCFRIILQNDVGKHFSLLALFESQRKRLERQIERKNNKRQIEEHKDKEPERDIQRQKSRIKTNTRGKKDGKTLIKKKVI